MHPETIEFLNRYFSALGITLLAILVIGVALLLLTIKGMIDAEHKIRMKEKEEGGEDHN